MQIAYGTVSAVPPACLIRKLSDDLIIAVFACAPFTSHGTLRAVCRSLRAALQSPAFREERRATGAEERGVVVVGGVTRDESRTGECWLLSDVVAGRATTMTRLMPLSAPRYSASSLVWKDEVWVLGGRNGAAVLNSSIAFDPRTQLWRACPSMGERRSGAVAGVVGGVLVVAGGLSVRGGAPSYLMSAEVLRYPAKTASTAAAAAWESLPPLPHAAWLATAGVLGGRLHVCGGVRSYWLQIWDGAAWSLGAPMPQPRWAAASAVTRDGRLVVIGGTLAPSFGDTASVIVYDPAANMWSEEVAELPPLPTPRSGCRTLETATGGLLVVGGGGPPLLLEAGAREWSELPSPVGDGGEYLASSGAVCESVLLG